MAKTKNWKGYLVIDLYINGLRKQYRQHRLIAETFIPNPNNLPQINHIDGDKTNNKVENLEWCTNRVNQLHYTKSIFPGTWRRKNGKYSTSLSVNNKKIHLGTYGSQEEASKVYKNYCSANDLF